MRSRLVDYLIDVTGMGAFNWLVPTPSVIYATALVVTVIAVVKRCGDSGLSRGTALDVAFWGGITGFIGARLFYLVFGQNGFPQDISAVFSTGGTASWGLYIGILLGALLYLRIRGKPPLPYLDTVASCLPLGTFLGRWSCFLYGCDYGTVTDAAWGVRYPADSKAYAAHLSEHLIEPTARLSAAVHPNQIYLSINALVVFVFITWFWRKYRHHPGLTLGVFWLAYGFSRFFLEFFRDVPSSTIIPALNTPQITCLSLVSLSAVFVVILHFRNRPIHIYGS